VRVSLRFRGREITHSEVGMRLFERLKEDTAEVAKVELHPKMEGNSILMVLVPKVS
jgi:translation initiation factor IF-3